MKKIKQYLLTGLAILLVSPLTIAQDFDANRMNGDMRIMENILGELFKIQPEDSRTSGTFSISGFNLSGKKAQGTYLPGYGIIFRISPDYKVPQTISVVKNEKGKGLNFYYKSEEEESEQKVDEESVISRITEFMKDYAPTIGQLKDEDNILVIYGSKMSPNFNLRVFNTNSQQEEEKQEPFPVISVSAKKRDLNAFKSGRLNEEGLEDRISFSKSEDKEYLDIKVMGTIFDTAFESEHALDLINKDPKEAVRLSGKVNHLMLENFGVLFSMNARYDDNSRLAYASMKKARIFFNAAEDEGKKNISISTEEDSERSNVLKEAFEERQERLKKALDEFKTKAVQYLVDYGRTLKSVESEQNILISVVFSKLRSDRVPERLDIQVKKSVLEQLDKGAISREEAIQKVVIREY